MFLSLMPYWVWHFLAGIVIGLVLIYWYRRSPMWFRLPAFILTVPGWPIALLIWIGYEVIVKSPPVSRS